MSCHVESDVFDNTTSFGYASEPEITDTVCRSMEQPYYTRVGNRGTTQSLSIYQLSS
jgi:hypothetical protein